MTPEKKDKKMAVGTNIWTYFGNAWNKGDLPVMKAADHATWLGTLVFDGARAFEGLMPDLDLHLARVNHSAHVMGLKPTLAVNEMTRITREGMELLGKNRPVYIRPMYWSTGSGPGVVPPNPDSTVFCMCLEELPMAPPTASQTLTSTQFVRPTLASAVVNAKAACLYPNNARMLRDAQSKGFNNALVLDPLGNVAETATANVFMVKNGIVMTPVPNGTFLNGITRQRVISLLREDGLTVEERTLSQDDFRNADEVFMTGNISKVTPVSRYEDVEFGPGKVAPRAREIYWDWAARGQRL